MVEAGSGTMVKKIAEMPKTYTRVPGFKSQLHVLNPASYECKLGSADDDSKRVPGQGGRRWLISQRLGSIGGILESIKGKRVLSLLIKSF